MDYVIITGATSGIGYEFSKIYAEKGYGLILVATNLSKLKELKESYVETYKIPVLIIQQDLSQPEAAKIIYEKIKESRVTVDVLINNAGFGLIGPTEKIDYEKDVRMLYLNMITLTNLCKLFLPDFYVKKHGRILNISSIGAFQPGPYTATYFASKSYVLSYTRAIRHEAKKNGVNVSALCPGTTKTQFFIKEGLDKTPNWSMTAKRAATIGFKKFNKNRGVIVPGILNNLLRIVPAEIKLIFIANMKSITKHN